MYKLKNGGVVRVVETERDAEMYKKIGYEVIDTNYSPEKADVDGKKKDAPSAKPPKEA
jgi:hypothetical protein